jgi:hypothetical protein
MRIMKPTTEGAHSVTVGPTGHTHAIDDEGNHVVECDECAPTLAGCGWAEVFPPRDDVAPDREPVSEAADREPIATPEPVESTPEAETIRPLRGNKR